MILISVFSCVYSLLRPFHRDNVYYTCQFVGKLTALVGVSVEVKVPDSVKDIGPVVYVANHQNNYDVMTLANAILPGTVSVGKKSLVWIPFFGLMYWLTGNILIDRQNKSKAFGTIELTANKVRKKKLSIWMFPEGTRSRGRGLLRFKTGAFRTAYKAGVPIVPVCASNQVGNIKLGRWHNTKVVIELLDPIYIDKEENIRDFADDTHRLMANKIDELNLEISSYNK
ncbi:MAG: 1-acylglycerol-3-phosphate O-acyltransferase [Colwellia sp.]